MRKIATINKRVSEICRLMIYESKKGVYVFQYADEKDGPCIADEWYETLSEAEESCMDNYGVKLDDWKLIEDPRPGCQHDWIKPTKVKLDSNGEPIWGEYESAE